MANWTAAKNHRFLLPVLGDLVERGVLGKPGDPVTSSWRWRIIGSHRGAPGLAEEFRREVEELELNVHISIEGEIPPEDVRGEMKRADIFVYPSLFESYGMVVAEALAAGLPVVANNVGGIPEILGGDGQVPAAILCDPHAARAQWRKALSRLIESPEERRRLRGAALRRAGSLPGWQKTAGIILSSLESA